MNTPTRLRRSPGRGTKLLQQKPSFGTTRGIVVIVITLVMTVLVSVPADAVVDGPVLGNDMREVDLGSVPANTTADLTLTLTAADTSFFVVADTTNRDATVSIDEITAPDGTTTMTNILGGPSEGSGEAGAQWPLVASQAIAAGDYTITVGSTQPLTVRAFVKTTNVSAALSFDVKLWDVTSEATVNTTAIEAAWRANAASIFGPHNITVGSMEFIRGDAAAIATHAEINLPTGGNDSEQRDACRAFNAITGDDRTLHFVLIDRFIDTVGGGETLGNSAGIPGAPLDSQFDASCVVVTAVTGIEPDPQDTNALLDQGVTAWHEAGHFLGLAHTSETTGEDFDFLADTPECNIVDGTSAQCPDGANFMFNDTDMTTMSAQQAFLLRRHPLMKAATTASSYEPLNAARILDSRNATQGAYSTPWTEGEIRSVAVTGVGGVPATGVKAVAINVTTVSPTAPISWLTISPTGEAAATTAVHNFGTANATTSLVNDVIMAKVGAGGAIDVRNEFGSVDLVVDVVGYYAATGGFGYQALSPSRILDSRNATQGEYSTPWGEGQTRSVLVAGVGGVPATGAEAVVLNVTTVSPTAGLSWLTVSPTGSTPAITAAHNFGTDSFTTEIVNDVVIAKVGTGGAIDVRNEFGSVDLVVDVVGYYATTGGSLYRPLNPSRILDSRNATQGDYSTPWAAGQSRTVATTFGTCAEAVVLHITTVTPSADFSWLTVTPAGEAASTTAAHNFGTASFTSELTNDVVIARTGTNGSIDIRNEAGSVDLVVDLVGFYGTCA